MPFEGDAFLHSHIKESSGFLRAFSKENLSEVTLLASSFIICKGIFFFFCILSLLSVVFLWIGRKSLEVYAIRNVNLI